jgi:hypothetical protein
MKDTRWGIPYRCQWHRQREFYSTSVNDTSNANDIAKFWLSSVNVSDRTYQIANISYTKPTRFQLSDTESERYQTYQMRNLSGTKQFPTLPAYPEMATKSYPPPPHSSLLCGEIGDGTSQLQFFDDWIHLI